MVYENVAGRAGHCPERVESVGRWKFLKGWTKVWSCERHADSCRRARRWVSSSDTPRTSHFHPLSCPFQTAQPLLTLCDS